MHRRGSRVRVFPARSGQVWAGLVSVGVAVVSALNGCATAVDTLEPLTDVAGDSGSSSLPAGGKPSSAGSGTSGGTSNGSGGKPVSAFGGTSTSGGKGGSSVGGAGGTGGANGNGGSTNAGSGGTTSQGGGAGGAPSGGSASGGKGGAGGSSNGGSSGSGTGGAGGSGTTLACLMSWKGDKCDTCSTQVQSDKAACADILNCYAANNCGPATCGGNTEKCGANNIGKGTAGYPIAQDVYTCLCK
jgi:hypothetical protein